MKTKKVHMISLKLDKHLEKPIKDLAAKNRRTMNDEINIAVEHHVTEKHAVQQSNQSK